MNSDGAGVAATYLSIHATPRVRAAESGQRRLPKHLCQMAYTIRVMVFRQWRRVGIRAMRDFRIMAQLRERGTAMSNAQPCVVPIEDNPLIRAGQRMLLEHAGYHRKAG